MIANREDRPRLYGRPDECEVITRLVDGVRAGHGAVLVVRGEPGAGKTALLDYAAGLSGDLRMIRISGAESETELTYAGLYQLRGPMAGLLGQLPEPQRVALDVVFATRAGTAPDRFLLGLGILGLLTGAAAQGPLACLIDDAHWLDRVSQQALAFAARRLSAEPVLLIFATREPEADLAGLPELPLRELPNSAARELLAAEARSPLDERVREQIVAEAHGNPGTLTELIRGLPPMLLAGGFGLPDLPPGQIPETLRRQISELPELTRFLLLLAAADPTGDPTLMLRAAVNLGLPSDAGSVAAETGLITVGTRVVFRQPTVRSAAYQLAPKRDQRAVHGALARATVTPGDEDRRAWHRGKAAVTPDEDVAVELERTAPQARARGGLPADAAFLRRAALLTADATQRPRRALAAAAALLRVGEPDGAARLLDLTAGDMPDDGWRARADLIRGRLAFAESRGGQVPRLLLDAARRLDRSDAPRVRRAYLDAIRAVTFAGGLAASGGTATDVASAAGAAPSADQPGPADLLLDGLTAYLTGERAAGAAIMRQALDGFDDGAAAAPERRWLPLACVGAQYLWDDAAWHRLSGRYVGLTRDSGALGDLPLALDSLACSHLLSGELDAAGALAAEARAAAEAMGSSSSPYAALILAALRGQPDPALELIDAAARDAALRAEGIGVAAAHWAAAVLHNGLGQYETALTAAEDAVRYAGAAPLAGWAAAELVEAAARSGQPARAAGAMRALSRSATATGTGWALGLQARSLALLSDSAAAENLYRAAIANLGRSRARIELARAHLLYGEWLRRENRRVDAREQLRAAHQALGAAGAGAFAERARRELLATGETVRKRAAASDRSLTGQEMQIAVRAAGGPTNTQIGAELFLSPRTVEWHLRKVFAKLGITSRRQLQQALRGATTQPCGQK